MLVVRPAQMTALAEQRRAAFIEDLRAHIDRHFPQALAGRSPEQARGQIEATIHEAAEYRLISRRDVSRFANLAAVHGWDMLARPANAWMRERYLVGGDGTPSERLDRLVAACLRQEEVAAHNAALAPAPRRAGAELERGGDE